jgi:hypothetical protein
MLLLDQIKSTSIVQGRFALFQCYKYHNKRGKVCEYSDSPLPYLQSVFSPFFKRDKDMSE